MCRALRACTGRILRMASKSTPWLTAFAALGLAAATWSTWVHYQILNSPTYESFCDVNSTLELHGGVYEPLRRVWRRAGGVARVVVLRGRAGAHRPLLAIKGRRAESPGYVFAASTIGLAVVLYLAYASYFILHVVCLLCAGTYVAVIGLFLISGAATNVPLTSLPMRILDDLKLLVRTPRALTATVVFIVAAAAAIVVFPEQPVTAAANAPGERRRRRRCRPRRPRRFSSSRRGWRSSRAYTVMAPSDGAAVVIIKFNDYQCPGCGQTYRDYKPVLAKWAKQAPGKVKFITKDYPLERQCNQFVAQDLHLGACEAAVAVRLAREKGKAEAMEEWLYSNQAAMNPDSVKKAAASIGGVTDFDARFAGTLELVKADVAQGAQLKISGTPSFFMNGMQLPGLRGEFFDAAIAWELRRVSGGK